MQSISLKARFFVYTETKNSSAFIESKAKPNGISFIYSVFCLFIIIFIHICLTLKQDDETFEKKYFFLVESEIRICFFSFRYFFPLMIAWFVFILAVYSLTFIQFVFLLDRFKCAVSFQFSIYMAKSLWDLLQSVDEVF